MSLNWATTPLPGAVQAVLGDNGADQGAVPVAALAAALRGVGPEVELPADTVIGSADGSGAKSNLFDGDFSTYWQAANASGDWAGIDLGSGNSAELTSVRLAPRESAADSTIEHRPAGAVIEGSDDPTFASGVVPLLQIPAFPFAPRNQWTEFAIDSRGQSFRCFRVVSADGASGSLSALAFVGTPSDNTLGKPLAPTVSPWGGNYPAGKPLVTLATRSTGAAIYYTTDGSTPDSTDTLYQGPFRLTLGGGVETVLKAVAYDAARGTTTSDVSTARFRPWGWKPSEDWYDVTTGELLEMHAPGILNNMTRDGWFYGYGDFCNRANDPSNLNDTKSNEGVWCYRTRDGMNWEKVGQILPTLYLDDATLAFCERPCPAYCPATGKYVLWAHLRNADASVNYAGQGVSDYPDRGWKWYRTDYLYNGHPFKDCDLFVDDDGAAYIATGNNVDQWITRLSDDFLSATAHEIVVNEGHNREAPVLAKRGGNYYFFSSGTNYYSDTGGWDRRVIVNTSGDLMDASAWPTDNGTALDAVSPTGGTYNGQPSDVFIPPWRKDAVVLFSDRWFNPVSDTGKTLYDSRYVVLPVDFSNPLVPVLPHLATWDWSYYAGGPAAAPSAVVTAPAGVELAPTVVAASLNAAGDTLTLYLSKPVAGHAGFTITPTGGASALTYSSGDGTNTLTYTLGRAVHLGETVTLAFTPGDVTDSAGNVMAAFTGFDVPNGSTVVSVTPIATLDASDATKTFQDSSLTTPATANNDPVGGVADAAGNGYDFTQATSGARPLLKTGGPNGKNYLSFDGSNDFLASTLSDALKPVTVVFVMRRRNYSAYYGIYAGNDSSALELRSDITSGVMSALHEGVTNIGAASTAPTANTWAVETFRYDGSGNWSWRLNGSANGSGVTDRTFTARSVVVGKSSDGFGPIDLAEIRVYDSALSDSAAAAEEADLATKYGL